MTSIDPTRRGNEYWAPEPLLDCQTVFLLGGGPSLVDVDATRLRGLNVMAINSSCVVAPWAPFLFFTDTNWFDDHRRVVEEWPGVVVTSSRQAKEALPDKLHRIHLEMMPEFTKGQPTLKFGRSSGHTAISLSVSMGAIRVILLGYDMRRVGGRSHFHDEYGTEDDKMYRDDFLVHFTGWNEAARRCGVRIINCTPDSALREFPMGDLDAEIEAARAA